MTQLLEGFKDLEKKISALQKFDRGKVLRAGGNAAGQVVVKRARGKVPVGDEAHKTYKGRLVSPGFASRSIKKNVVMDRARTKVDVRVGVKKEAFYAINFIELGTAHIPKKPWLTPAFTDTEDQQLIAFGGKVKEWLLKVAAK